MDSLVSIIIPLYNAVEFIEESINSVLQQSYKKIEVLVIDDGSSDGSLELVYRLYSKESRVKILVHPNNSNLGVSKSRELGIENSNGDYIAFLDADDFFHEEKLEKQLKLLKETNAILCHSKASLEFADGLTLDDFSWDFGIWDKLHYYNFSNRKDVFVRNLICNSSVIVKASCLKNLNIGTIQLFQFEDWLTWILLGHKGDFLYTPEKLVHYRYHKKSSTFSLNKSNIKFEFSRLELLITYILNPNSTSVLRSKAFYYILFALCRLFKFYSNERVKISTINLMIKFFRATLGFSKF